MTSTRESEVNRRKLEQLSKVVREVLDEILRRGFHGNGGFNVSVQDGTIQHIRRTVEQVDR